MSEAAGTIHIRFTLNGQPVSLDVEPREMLLDVLRERLNLRGAKRSCDVQICGACTVLVDGAPVSSCTYLACEVDGKRVETVEGMAQNGRLHPLQEAFIEHGALQCGFCTPGMLMTAKALLEACPHPTREDMITYMNGNICRCTGYVKILEAIEAAAHKLSEGGSVRAGHQG